MIHEDILAPSAAPGWHFTAVSITQAGSQIAVVGAFTDGQGNIYPDQFTVSAPDAVTQALQIIHQHASQFQDAQAKVTALQVYVGVAIPVN